MLVADIVVNSGDDDGEILGDDVRHLHDVASKLLITLESILTNVFPSYIKNIFHRHLFKSILMT